MSSAEDDTALPTLESLLGSLDSLENLIDWPILSRDSVTESLDHNMEKVNRSLLIAYLVYDLIWSAASLFYKVPRSLIWQIRVHSVFAHERFGSNSAPRHGRTRSSLRLCRL